MILYTVVRRVMRIVTHLYFVDVQSSGLENIPRQGPAIIAANHPGSLLDAVLLSALVPRRVHFLAKSELFRFPVLAAFFRGLGVIPIYQAGRAPGQGERNQAAFEEVQAVLERGGCIGIFPEGRNSPRGQVTAIRTGAARMALGAEASNGYKLDVSLLPVGLNFESRELLLSSVFLSFDQPIRVADYADWHSEDPEGAVRGLTDALQQALRRQALHIEDIRLNRLVADLSLVSRQSQEPFQLGLQAAAEAPGSGGDNLWRSGWRKLTDWFRPAPRVRQDLEAALRARQQMVKLLARAEEHEPGIIDELTAATARYKDHLSQLRLKEDLANIQDKPVQERFLRWRMTLYAVCMAPVALAGFLLNVLPYGMTLVSVRFFKEEAIRGFACFAIGLAAFCLTYAVYAAGVWHLATSSPLFCLLFLALALWSGFACLRYRRKIMRYRDRILVRTFFQTKEDLSQGLRRERRAIIERLQALSKKYDPTAV